MVGGFVIAADGIWAGYEDGSGLTQITQDVALHRRVSVSGRWVADGADRGADEDAGASSDPGGWC